MKKYKKLLTKEFLIKKYSINEQSADKIAKQMECVRETIYNYLRKYNIPIRTLKESHADVSAENNPMFGKRGIETGNYKGGLTTTKKYYCIDCLKVGIQTEISYSSCYYSNQLCKSCSHKGERCGSYIDGRSEEIYPYKFRKLKDQIHRRDNYQCQGEDYSITQEEHLIIYGRDIETHHIDYNKQNCNEENLITLCKRCNLRANFNRNYWTNYFENKIKEFA